MLDSLKQNKNLVPIIDYWDYIDSLAYRYFLSRAIQLTEKYISIEKYKDEMKLIDDVLKSLLQGSEVMLDKSVQKYYPKDDYWWYYGKPTGCYFED